MSGQRLYTPLSPPQLSALGIGISSGPPYLAPTPSHLKPFSQASARVPPSPSSLRMAQRLFHLPQQQFMHLRRLHYPPALHRAVPPPQSCSGCYTGGNVSVSPPPPAGTSPFRG
ncbi:hypothetical protein R3P38DRAFT_3241450 [Favolaschia claudopus]|uniref:Uncharacterized protein n=1 Tax=Favolaschia claudopus TaxID=2862362 RepID=A0AAV9Z6F5_9AGAR